MMKSKLNLECLSERITPSVGVDNPGVTGYSVPTASSVGQPQDQIPTPEDVAKSGLELVLKLNDLSNKVAVLLVDLQANEDALEMALKRARDPNLSPTQRLFAAIEFMALAVEYEKLVDRLRNTVDQYDDALGNLKAYGKIYNSGRGYGINFGPYLGLPPGYKDYMPRADPKDVV